MLLAGLTVVVCGLVLLIVSTLMSSSVPAMAYVSVVAVAVFVAGLGIGPMLCIYAYPSEITTQITRPNAYWISGICFWLTAALVAFVVPYSLGAWGGFAYIPFLLLVLVEVSETRLCYLVHRIKKVVPKFCFQAPSDLTFAVLPFQDLPFCPRPYGLFDTGLQLFLECIILSSVSLDLFCKYYGFCDY